MSSSRGSINYENKSWCCAFRHCTCFCARRSEADYPFLTFLQRQRTALKMMLLRSLKKARPLNILNLVYLFIIINNGNNIRLSSTVLLFCIFELCQVFSSWIAQSSPIKKPFYALLSGIENSSLHTGLSITTYFIHFYMAAVIIFLVLYYYNTSYN